MRIHCVEGYVALKHPAPGNLFCPSTRCHESIETAIVPLGVAAVPVGGTDCDKPEHADSAADNTAIQVSREKFTSSTFQ
jgi:hypothetical protein